MNRVTRIAFGTCLFLSAAAGEVLAAEPTLPRDGWVSWEVATTENAPATCCFASWQNGEGKSATCKLDQGLSGFGTRNHEITNAARVYARATAGKLDRLQVLATGCPVETRTPIRELAVDTDDSARWLVARAKESGTDAVSGQPVAEGALMALGVHRGDVAQQALAKFAREDSRADTRRWAVFWLAVVRGDEGADVVSSVMFKDPDAEVRERAAFALSQSRSARVTADLVRLGKTDQSGEVRAKAWFWLAHTGAANAEQHIGDALHTDSDDNVREQAVFALSQLPDDRATRALIAAAEDRSLSREHRKRAVFWLSQSGSDSAQAYLDKVLAR